MGGRSDAYRPKANVAGGRFQLCKYGDPNDETIAPGFSGAPIWNDDLQGVIGMVATAGVVSEKQQHTAYAIPTREACPLCDDFSLDERHATIRLKRTKSLGRAMRT